MGWKLCSLLIWIFALTEPVMSQNILSIHPGAKGAALGAIKATHKDVLAMYGNPAGLVYLSSFSIQASAEKRFNVEGIQFYSLAGAVPSKYGVFGFTVQRFGFDEFNEKRIGFAYARPLMKSLDMGIQFDYLQVQIPTYGSKSALSAVVGLQSEVSPGLRGGFFLYNPFEIKWTESEVLVTGFTLGLRYDATKKVSIFSELEKLTNHPENVKLGMQYYILDQLAIRIGFHTSPGLLAFGIGYQLDGGFSLDFASTSHQNLGFSPIGSFGFQKHKP